MLEYQLNQIKIVNFLLIDKFWTWELFFYSPSISESSSNYVLFLKISETAIVCSFVCLNLFFYMETMFSQIVGVIFLAHQIRARPMAWVGVPRGTRGPRFPGFPGIFSFPDSPGNEICPSPIPRGHSFSATNRWNSRIASLLKLRYFCY